VGKLEVKVKKTNPSPNQTNPQPINNIKVQSQTQNSSQTQNNNLSLDQLYQLLQQLQKQQNLQQNSQPQQGGTGEFIVKAAMKASYVTAKVEQLLLYNKRATISAIGFAVPIALDSIMLLKRDLENRGMQIGIKFELFEKEVYSGTRKKGMRVTGLRAILTI